MKFIKSYKKFPAVAIAVLAFLLLLALSAAAGNFIRVRAAEQAESVDVTETGIDFISSVPGETVEYAAGEGTLTYIPADAEGVATIILDNAELYAGTRVNYWSNNNVYAGIAAKGDVTVILKGDSRIYSKESGINSAMLFYNSNVTVKGDGTLTIGYKGGSVINFNTEPINVIADNDIKPEDPSYSLRGNLVIESGTLVVHGEGAIGCGCVTVSNGIEINGGQLRTYGQMAGIYSVYDDIEINGGIVRAENFNEYGLYARRGDVTINDAESVYISSDARTTTVGISAGNRRYSDECGTVTFNGGNTEIHTRFMGVFAQSTDSGDAGKIEFNGGTADIEISGGTENKSAALCAKGSAADIIIKGGTINAALSGDSTDFVAGMYADRSIIIENGDVVSCAQNSDVNGFAYGADAGTISYTGGNLMVCGGTSAINTADAPVYEQNMSIFAATDMSGEDIVSYDEQNLSAYKYLKFGKAEIISVTIAPVSAQTKKNATLQLRAEVNGTGKFDPALIWKIDGATSADTRIDENGLLAVAADETADKITVTAVSAADPGKSAAASVTVLSDENSSCAGGEQSQPDDRLTGGEIAAIIAGVIVAAAAIAVVTVLIVNKKRNKK